MTQDFAADASITKRIGRIFSLMAGLLAVLLISGTAIYAQNLTKFGVAKTITGPTGAPALTNLNFGVNAKQKLSNPGAKGAPEDQLRAPFEQLLADICEICNFASGVVVPVGETSLSDLKIRPDYSVTVHGALVGFVEMKAPGKGAD